MCCHTNLPSEDHHHRPCSMPCPYQKCKWRGCIIRSFQWWCWGHWGLFPRMFVCSHLKCSSTSLKWILFYQICVLEWIFWYWIAVDFLLLLYYFLHVVFFLYILYCCFGGLSGIKTTNSNLNLDVVWQDLSDLKESSELFLKRILWWLNVVKKLNFLAAGFQKREPYS